MHNLHCTNLTSMQPGLGAVCFGLGSTSMKMGGQASSVQPRFLSSPPHSYNHEYAQYSIAQNVIAKKVHRRNNHINQPTFSSKWKK